MQLLILIGKDARFLAVASEAARFAYPDASVRMHPSVAEAMKADQIPGAELMALADPADAEVAQATAARDALRLPRWAVLVFGDGRPENSVDLILREEWTVPVVARAFRSAVARHALKRENARLQGDLLSISVRIAHDLRTPLGCILIAAEALKEIEGDEAASTVQPIITSADEIAAIVRQTSLLTRATAAPEARQSFNMERAVLTAKERLHKQILQAGATLSEPASWPEVAGDISWSEAIWWHLIKNALQYAGPAPRIELGWKQQDADFRFSVSDNGAGVRPEKRPALFQPFHQLHDPGSRRGLGLSIVERLVQLQGGRPGYEPTPAGGSCFFFTLPAAENAKPARG